MRTLATKLFVFIFLLGAFTLGAQSYNPPAGALFVPSIGSPEIEGSGLVSSSGSPFMTEINPSAAALNLDPLMAVGATGIFDSSSKAQGFGGGLAATAIFPTPSFVWGIGGRFIATPDSMTGLPLGTLGIVSGTISKELYTNWLVGAGLNTSFGYNGGQAWSLTANLGLTHIIGSFAFMEDWRWAVVLSGLGLGYSTPKPSSGLFSSSASTAYPPPFSLSASSEAIFYKNDWFRLRAGLGLEAPSFSDLVITPTVNTNFFNLIEARLSLPLSVREMSAGVAREYWPSLSVSARIPLNVGPNDERVFSPLVAVTPLYNSLFALGVQSTIPLSSVDNKAPVISAKFPVNYVPASAASPDDGVAYFSPNNDGVYDTLTIPLSITDEHRIVAYALKVKSKVAVPVQASASAAAPDLSPLGAKDTANGAGISVDDAGLVRLISNKETRVENEGIAGIWDRITYKKTGVSIPDELVWDGRLSDGSSAPDGEYEITIEAIDNYGNKSIVGPFKAVIDTVAPTATIQVAQADGDTILFSPDGDGNKDSLVLNITTSAEDDWSLSTSDSTNKQIGHREFQGAVPTTYTWNGEDDLKRVVPDGLYSLKLFAIDRAGNTGGAVLNNVFVDTVRLPVNIFAGSAAFSPNADGVQDTENLLLTVPAGGLTTWKLSILDSSQKTVWEKSGTAADLPKASFAFDGKNVGGLVLPEGSYQAQISAVYRNGYSPKASSPFFALDVTAPNATIKADRPAFNPRGNEQGATVNFAQKSSKETLWFGEVLSGDKVVRTLNFIGEVPANLSWDGRNDNDEILPDGNYQYRLRASDLAGNSFVSKAAPVTIDTAAKDVDLFFRYVAFSPNGDGVKDIQDIDPQLKVRTGISSYELTILTEDKKVVRTWKGGSDINTVKWDGKDDGGKAVPDGTYSALLTVSYQNGDKVNALSGNFDVLSTMPTITASSDRSIFSPNGDGHGDIVTIKQSSRGDVEWQGNISLVKPLDPKASAPDKTLMRSFTWKEGAPDFTWDGRDDIGNIVADGVYQYEVKGTDRAGNAASAIIKEITVDNRPTTAYLTSSDKGLSPNGDGIKDDIKFTPIVKLTDGIANWELTISAEQDSKKILQSFSGVGKAPPASFVWDGKDKDGKVIEGNYRARLKVVYNKGDELEALANPVIVDIQGPSVNIDLTPNYFSPDNDGVDDELSIGLKVSDASPIQDWSMQITETAISEEKQDKPVERNFISFNGQGQPSAEIKWDGRSSKGELVESATNYPYYFTISDIFGNKTKVKAAIAIDVLVVREGDKLKMKIPSIIFRANAADFVGLSPEIVAQNNKVLGRIAEILNRFGDYKVIIEGHGNNIGKITGASASAIATEEKNELLPLSTARAELVSKILSERGVNKSRLDAQGMGSSTPTVPFSDKDNRWKNRRVEFILLK